jgi:hypothetical protein
MGHLARVSKSGDLCLQLGEAMLHIEKEVCMVAVPAMAGNVRAAESASHAVGFSRSD